MIFTGKKFQNLVRRRYQNFRAVSNFRGLSRLCYYFVKKLFDKLREHLEISSTDILKNFSVDLDYIWSNNHGQ